MRRESNVFDDLGFSPQEAFALEMKTKLHTSIVKQAKHYKQSTLASMLGEPQPRISDLLRGKISKFSIDVLLRYAKALHMSPEIKTRPAKAHREHSISLA